MSTFLNKVFSNEPGFNLQRGVFSIAILLVLVLAGIGGLILQGKLKAIQIFPSSAPSVPTSSSTPGTSGEAVWLTSHPTALQQATQENKPVFMFFTGSDWCGWCKKLHSEVLDTHEFKNYAARNLVLLELDFPYYKSQSSDVKQQNADLARTYGIRGYPTVIILNSKGQRIGQLGYMPGGPSAFLTELERICKSAS